MTRLLTGEEFLALFTAFKHTAYRLELRDRYNVPAEADRLAAYAAGDWGELERLNAIQRKPWMDLMRAAKAAGKRVERARVVTEPLTDYMRFTLRLTAGNIDAGEDIRFLPRDQTAGLGLPDVDAWLFDSRFIVVGRFNDADELEAWEHIDDPAAVVEHCAGRDAAWHHAIPYNEYARKWQGADRTTGA
ncbi:hypothetical protein HS041_03875 [Planomonospora sp. ID67723]|uniref:DUF6879 family protein n=1 Tax=Planomonospora sp. ID67723 TaxID=2738134 RepID=UPI0018C3D60A|nr:DUF6879 family protein [Planomonospora sp. ID67723]MBG0826909.1 hypothetical protein [Planomonospora sp. ID67723]